MGWIFPQNLRFQFFEARGKKTESIFEMKLFVDFFLKKLDLSFLALIEKQRVKSVSPLHFWKDIRSQISEVHEKIPDSTFDLAKNLN